MEDIRQFSDDELILIVMNDEYLYSIRHDVEHLGATLESLYISTECQFDTLIDYLMEL